MSHNIFSKTEHKILAFLCRYPFKSFYAAEIADKASLSKGGTNQVLHALAQKGLLETKTKGRMTFYQVDIKSPLIKQFKILHNIVWIQGLAKKITPYSERSVLFGSCAKGEDTAESDVDILIIAKEGEKSKIRSMLPEKKDNRTIQLVIKSPQEYVALENKEPVFYKELQEGIVLWQRE